MLSEVRRSMPRIAWWVVCSAVAVMFAFPIVMMLLQSFKAPAEAAASPPTLFPQDWSVQNYLRLSGQDASIDILRHVLNSVIVSGGAVVGTVVLSALGGYGFARLRFPGSQVLFFVVLATFMIPFQAIITPLFEVLRWLHVQNSLLGLTLVYITFQLPFGLFLMRNSFAVIPQTLEEAALLDGCGLLGALRRVMLPVALPGVVTTALFTFFHVWNEFFAALVLVTDQDKFTLPVTLSILQTGQFGTLDWGILQAGVAVTAVPCVVIFLLLQRYYVKGLLAGAVR